MNWIEIMSINYLNNYGIVNIIIILIRCHMAPDDHN